MKQEPSSVKRKRQSTNPTAIGSFLHSCVAHVRTTKSAHGFDQGGSGISVKMIVISTTKLRLTQGPLVHARS